MAFDKILIVDDSSTARMIIRKCVEISGFGDSEFFEAGDGLEALEFFGSNNIDLVITDINMPKMDGISFIKSLRDKELNPHIIVMTSVSDVLSDSDKERYDILGIIEKPISPAKVYEVLGGV